MDQHLEQILHAKQVHKYILKTSGICFKNCVHDFSSDKKTPAEETCIKNCIKSSVDANADM
jgi:hypothetical protein